ncbi:MAG: hypothetical protein ABR909_12440 [Candidatus Bathyarchaeia archaeon]
MVYKILIGFKLEPIEPVSNKEFFVTLTFQNIGDSVFVGGRLGKFSISGKSSTQKIIDDKLPKVPPININQTVTIAKESFNFRESGSLWLHVAVKADDAVEVQHFQIADFNLGQEWSNMFLVRDQDLDTIIKLLERIVNVLEKKEAK